MKHKAEEQPQKELYSHLSCRDLLYRYCYRFLQRGINRGVLLVNGTHDCTEVVLSYQIKYPSKEDSVKAPPILVFDNNYCPSHCTNGVT
ncbi:hypothetical protein CDAR_263031 [Caerostris darwini]|uniref:Uncharacterized protein n=1 Tax=Caerostris darwini TaxID=1538125 RepID=A0AAV4RXK8_9ARAC|nr:hypothetical protein CDAR_263031 [Caerostris darwini]